ncbi:MAG: RluA family pseudouridine synthase [Planctomycetota bacterium]|nr:RluA family pseudouridine synthase [Planctomycetota bacterium]
MPKLDILYEDNHLLVVNKPAGIATMGAEPGAITMRDMAADYLKHKFNKPGNVYVGIVSRLDLMTSGVLVLSRTSKAAARFSDQFSGRGSFPSRKLYLAAVQGHPRPSKGEWNDLIYKDDTAHRMRVSKHQSTETREAKLRYLTVNDTQTGSLLAIELLTGRKHQIRVQAAERGHAILGDRKYGSRDSFSAGIALHSWHLALQHPTKRNPMVFQASPPKSWRQASLPDIGPQRESLRQHFNFPTDPSP